MTEKYVVVKTEYQYNDEYHRSEAEGGIPIGIFKTKKQAEEFVRLKTKNWLVDQGFEELMGYSYGDLGDLFHRKPDYLTTLTESEFFNGTTDSDCPVWKKLSAIEINDLTEDQLDDLFRSLELKPYTIHVVK